jgi:hypothetical protein
VFPVFKRQIRDWESGIETDGVIRRIRAHEIYKQADQEVPGVANEYVYLQHLTARPTSKSNWWKLMDVEIAGKSYRGYYENNTMFWAQVSEEDALSGVAGMMVGYLHCLRGIGVPCDPADVEANVFLRTLLLDSRGPFLNRSEGANVNLPNARKASETRMYDIAMLYYHFMQSWSGHDAYCIKLNDLDMVRSAPSLDNALLHFFQLYASDLLLVSYMVRIDELTEKYLDTPNTDEMHTYDVRKWIHRYMHGDPVWSFEVARPPKHAFDIKSMRVDMVFLPLPDKRGDYQPAPAESEMLEPAPNEHKLSLAEEDDLWPPKQPDLPTPRRKPTLKNNPSAKSPPGM